MPVTRGERGSLRLNEERVRADDVRPDGTPHSHPGVCRSRILRYRRLLANDLLIQRVGTLVLISELCERRAGEEDSTIVLAPSRSGGAPLTLEPSFSRRL